MDPVLACGHLVPAEELRVPQSYPGCGGPNPSPADSHPGEIGPQIWAGRPGWTRLAMRHTVTSTGARVGAGSAWALRWAGEEGHGVVASAEAAKVVSDQVLVDRLRSTASVGGRADLCRPGPPVVVGHAQVGPPARDLGRLRGGRDAETWLGVLEGLDCFEGRSSLRTYVFTILVNRAKTKGVREHRTVPLSASSSEDGTVGPVVDPDRFQGPDGAYPGHWTSAGQPPDWHQPENRVVARETMSLVEQALEGLPERQRIVVTLRDVQGLSSDEACGILNLTAVNQRMLLHRGRSVLRAVLEDYYRA